MSALQDLLNTYRHASASEREKGTYFEDLIRVYLRNEATYRDLSSQADALTPIVAKQLLVLRSRSRPRELKVNSQEDHCDLTVVKMIGRDIPACLIIGWP